MQKLHLHFIGATSIHPGAPNPGTKAGPPSVRLTYAFCDERDKRITTPAGRYENERYKPSSGERAMLKRLRELDFGDDWTVESMPCVPDASHCFFVARRTVPFRYAVEVGDAS